MRYAIVGLGLIGGSLAWDLTQAGHEVWGVSRSGETCRQAVQRGIVQQADPNLDQVFPQSWDGVIVATPIAATLPTIAHLATGLQPGTPLTDVASVKGSLVETATRLWPSFVGGHPMAGTADHGLAAAQLGLFREAVYVVTPLPETDREALARVEELIRTVGAEVVHCHPVDHDQAVAAISHVPVWISAALIAAAAEQGSLARRLASSGFRDTSRVGGGNPELGVGMAQANRAAILAHLTVYRRHLTQIQDWILAEDWSSLQDYLQATQIQRPQFRGIQ
ncbi:MAG: prephenate/arogenate dehydrogenase [Synechococcales cyanobacterium]